MYWRDCKGRHLEMEKGIEPLYTYMFSPELLTISMEIGPAVLRDIYNIYIHISFTPFIISRSVKH